MVRVRLDITGVVQGVGFRRAVARIAGLVDGIRAGRDTVDLAAGFHAAVVRATATAAAQCAQAAGIQTIGLPGGVFVNRTVRDGSEKTLADNGFEVLTDRILSCNDGGRALGQAVVVRQQKGEDACASEYLER